MDDCDDDDGAAGYYPPSHHVAGESGQRREPSPLHGDAAHSMPFHSRLNPFDTESDYRLAQLGVTRSGLSIGVVDELLSAARTGPFVVRHCGELLDIVDSLPGAEYHPQFFSLPYDLSDPESDDVNYAFFSRGVRAGIEILLARHGNSALVPPDTIDFDGPVTDIFQAKDYREQLHSFNQLAEPTDILLPLILFSDETNLTSFNTNSDQSTAYPLFLTLGLLPATERRKSDGLVNIAMLPKFLKRLHTGSASVLADLKRLLTSLALESALGDLIHGVEQSGDVASRRVDADASERTQVLMQEYAYIGEYSLFGEESKRRVFAYLSLYLGDLPEQLRLLWLHHGHCPNCLDQGKPLTPGQHFRPRTMPEALDTIEDAKLLRLVKDVRELLSASGMAALHAKAVNVLYELILFSRFSADRLHLRCAPVCMCGF